MWTKNEFAYIAGAERFSVGREEIIAFDATIKEYLKEIDESSLLKPEEEYSLGKLVVEENDPEARERLVRSNLRLVVNIAKRYADRGMSLGDLIEEGNLGLIKAVDYFDPERGIRFSTYAAWWIKQSIKRSLLMNTQPIHIPTYMVALINQWRHIAAELEIKFGTVPEVEQVANVMQISLRKAKVIHEIVDVLSSVRDTSGEDELEEDQVFETAIRNQDTCRPEDALVASEEKSKILKLLDEITPREADILRLHYGLNGSKPWAMKEIAEKFGLTKERIRQIQREALTKLYEYMDEE